MTYNGWKNWETWNVKLWLDNDQASYEYWRECAQLGPSADALAEELRGFHDENAPATAGIYTHLLRAALAGVDWLVIAESMLNDVDES